MAFRNTSSDAPDAVRDWKRKSMDANNRQNQSTQTVQNGTFPDSAKRMRQESLDQNTAFGTVKKPEGFVTTWKSATHLWRWRAVLCVFLSLLLTMMQPAGNALYRSWNADTGDMMGLAVALTGTSNATDLAAGSADLAGNGANSNLVTFDEKPITDYKIPIDNRKLITYYSSPEYAPSLLRWTNKDQMKKGTANISVNGVNKDVEIYEYKYESAGDGKGYADRSVAVGDSVGKPAFYADRGNLGAVSTITNSYGVKEGQTSWTMNYVVPTNKSLGVETAKSPWWALGYGIDSWVLVNPETYTDDAIMEALPYSADASYDEGDILTVFDTRVAYTSKPSTNTTTNRFPRKQFVTEETQNGVTVETGEKGYAFSAYANWAKKTTYSFVAMVGDTEICNPIASYAWDSDIHITNQYSISSLNYLFDNSTKNKFVWVPDVNSSYQSEVVGNLGMKGPDGKFWMLVNRGPDSSSGLTTDAKVDPRYPGGYYYNSSNEGRIVVRPYLGIEYNANGGIGGTTSCVTPQVSDGSTKTLGPNAKDFCNSYGIPRNVNSILAWLEAHNCEEDDGEIIYWYFGGDTRYLDALDYASDNGLVTVSGGGEVTIKGFLSSLPNPEDVNVSRPAVTDETTGVTTSYTFLGWTYGKNSAKSDYTETPPQSDYGSKTDYQSGKILPVGTDLSAVEINDSETIFYAVWQKHEKTSSINVTATASHGNFLYGKSGDANYVAPSSSIVIKGIPVGDAGNTKFNAITFDKPTVVDGQLTATYKSADDGGTFTLDMLTTDPDDGYEDTGLWKGTAKGGTSISSATLGALGNNVLVPDASTSITFEYDRTVYDVGVTVNGGTVNGASSFTIKGVPAGTKFNEITYKETSSGVFEWKDEGENLLSMGASPKTTSNETHAGKWTVTGSADDASETEINEALSFTWNFEFTVKYVIEGGRWSNDSMELTDPTSYKSGDIIGSPEGMPVSLPSDSGTGTSVVKADNDHLIGTTWKGEWSVEGGGTLVNGKPAGGTIAGDATYTYTLFEAKTVTLKADASVAKWADTDNNTNDKEFKLFAGESLSSNSIATYTIPTGMEAKSENGGKKYEKSDGTSKGYWHEGTATGKVVASGPDVETPVNDDATYVYAFQPVHTITFKIENGTWSSNDSNDKIRQTFDGEALDGAYASLEGVSTDAVAVDSATYRKPAGAVSSGESRYRGYWEDPASTAFESTPTKDATYTYNFHKIDTVTFKITGGVWSETGTQPSVGSDTYTEYLFNSVENPKLPTEVPRGSGYSGGHWTGAEPSSADPSNGSATYTYEFTAGNAKYYIRPHYQTPDAARSKQTGADAYYSVGAIVEVGTATAGRGKKLSAADIKAGVTGNSFVYSEEGYQLDTTIGDQPDGKELTPLNIEQGDDNTFDVYYTVALHTLTYEYTYDGYDSDTEDKFKELLDSSSYPDLPYKASGGKVSLAYQEPYAVKPISYTNGNYIWNGWKDGDTAVSGNKTMIADDVTYTGNWTRKRLNITLNNGDTTLGSINGSFNPTVSIPDVYYRDKLPAIATEGVSGYSFVNWYDAASGGNVNPLPTDPLTADISAGTYYAQWADTKTVKYELGAHRASTSPSTPDSHTGLLSTDQVPATRFTQAQIEAAEDGYKFDKWTWGTNSSWDPDDAHTDGTSITLPYKGSVGDGITFTATYVGLPHEVEVDWNGGAPSEAYKEKADGIWNMSNALTGQGLQLPKVSDVTKKGYTLESFTFDQDGATYGADNKVSPNTKPSVLAGASPFTKKLTITANYTPIHYSASYVHSSDQNSSAPTVAIPAITATTQTTFATKFDIPDQTGDTLMAESHIFAYYSAAGADGTTLNVENANDPDGAYISADEMAKVDGNIVITVHWNIRKYTVTWELVEGLPNDVKLDGATGSPTPQCTQTDVEWGTPFTSLAHPSLMAFEDNDTIETYKGGSEITWTANPSDTGNKVTGDIAFTGVPKRNTHSLTIKVVNGYFGTTGTNDEIVYAEVDHKTAIKDVDSQALRALTTRRSTADQYSRIPEYSLTIDGVEQGGDIKSPFDASNDTQVLKDMVYTVTYPLMIPVKFDVTHGVWNAETITRYGLNAETQKSATITVYVPKNSSLETHYATTADPTEYSTGFVAPEPGDAVLGYHGENPTWVQKIGTEAEVEVGSVDTGASIETTVDYRYDYKINTKIPWKVTVYYQKADPPTSSSDYSIYTQNDYEGETTVTGIATFGDKLTMKDLYATTAADGKILIPTGFDGVNNPADHSSDGGVKSDIELDIDAETERTATVYIDRKRVQYKYSFDETNETAPANMLTTQEENGIDVRYDQNVELKPFEGLSDDKWFNGWKVDSDNNGVGDGNVVTSMRMTDDMTSLVGTWSTATYAVKYQLLPRTLTEYLTEEYDTGATMSLSTGETWDSGTSTLTSNPVTIHQPAPVPTITYSDSTKYHEYGWMYKVGDEGTWIKVNSPADVPIESEGYVFAPIIELHRYTVCYKEGDHGQTVIQEPEYTTFTVKYGDAMPAPPTVVDNSATPRRERAYNEIKAKKSGTILGAEDLGLDSAGDVQVIGTEKNAYHCATGDNPKYWETANTTHIEGYDSTKPAPNGTVIGDVTWTWVWEKQTYHVYFMGVEGSSMENVAGYVANIEEDPTDTDWYWSGDDGQTSTTHAIYWTGENSSIFNNLTTSEWNTSEKLPTDYSALDPTNPKKKGYKFKGWKPGNATAADTGDTLPIGDISVQAIYGGPYENDTAKQKLFVWAEWEGESSGGVRYHNNVTGALNKVSGTSIFPESYKEVEVDVTTNSDGETLRVGDKVILKTLADLDAMPKKDGAQGSFTQEGYTFLGWSTSPTAKEPDALLSNGYAGADGKGIEITEAAGLDLYAVYRANTYSIQWKDFNGDDITNAQVAAKHPEINYPEGDGNKPYTQVFTYNKKQKLTEMKTLVEEQAHNPGNDTLVKWVCDKGALDDEAELERFSAVDNDPIVLTTYAASKVFLTYDPGAGTENNNVKNMPAELTVMANAAETGDGVNHPLLGEATFVLAAAPNRAGYYFDGWKIDGTVYDLTEGHDTAYLMSRSDGYTAAAQWTARDDTPYLINRHYQKVDPVTNLGCNTGDLDADYTNEPVVGTFVGTTGSLVTVADAGIDPAVCKEGYKYTSSLGQASTRITGDGKASIDLYYNVNTYTVKFKYQNLPSSYKPDKEEIEVAYGTKLELPEANTSIPAYYSIMFNDNWVEFDGDSFVSAGEAGKEVEIKSKKTFFLFFQPRELSVTFEVNGDVDHNSKWGFDTSDSDKWPEGYDGTTQKITRKVSYGSAPSMKGIATDPTPVSPLTTSDYEFVGWISNKTGKVVGSNDPITESGVVYTAAYRQINVVEYSPGSYSYNDFATALKTSYPSLNGTYSIKDDAPLNLGPADLTTDASGNDVPKGKPGYKFDGWIDALDGNKPYTSLQDIYDNASNTVSHKFVAQWVKSTQSVVFYESDGTTEVATITGQLDDERSVPEAPEAANGQMFTGWVRVADADGGGMPATLGATDKFSILATNGAAYKATYAAKTATFLYDVADGAMGKVSKPSQVVTDTLATGVEYTVKATPFPGFKFDGWVEVRDDLSEKGLDGNWYTDPTTLAKDNPNYGVLTVQPGTAEYEDGKYVAKFSADPYQVTFVDPTDPTDPSLPKLKHGTVTPDYAGGSYQAVQRGEKVRSNGDAGYDVTYVVDPGYTFKGWNYEVWEESLDGDSIKIQKSATLFTEDPTDVAPTGKTVFTASYGEMASSVMFVSNGNLKKVSGSTDPILNGKTGDKVTLSANGFTWPGHTFIGWSKSADNDPNKIIPGTDSNNGVASYTLVGGPEVMYAVWDSEDVYVAYHNNSTKEAVQNGKARGTIDGGDFSDWSRAVQVEADTDCVALTMEAALKQDSDTDVNQYVPSYYRNDSSHLLIPGSAQRFKEWNTSPTGAGKSYAEGADILASALPTAAGERLDLYAIWEDEEFTVRLNGNQGILIPESGYKTDPEFKGVVYGETVIIPALMYQRTNYTFNGWTDGANPKFGDASGTGTTYKFLESDDVTIMATWKPQEGVLANANFTFHDMNNGNAKIPDKATGAPMAGGLATSDAPLANGAHDPAVGADYELEGWYAAPTGSTKLAGDVTYPTEAFKEHYEIGKNWTVEQIISTYYNDSMPLDKTGEYDSDAGNPPPVYWKDGGFTDEYKATESLNPPIKLYRWCDLTRYYIEFDPNPPNKETYDAEKNGVVEDQEVSLADDCNDTLTTSKYDFPGYKFRGWALKTGENAPDALQNVESIPGLLQGGVTVVGGPSAKDAVGIDSTTGGAAPVKVKLYAVWSAVPTHKVEYWLTYPGDGVENGVEGFTKIGEVNDLVWNTGDASGTAGGASAIVTYPDGYAYDEEAGIYPELGEEREHADVKFAEWYTSPNAVTNDVPNGFGPIFVGTDTVKDVVEGADKAGAPVERTGDSFTIKLYALWTTSGARLTYDADGASGTVPKDTVRATSSTSVTPAPLRTNELQKKGYAPNGWMTKADPTAVSLTDMPDDSAARYGGTADNEVYTFGIGEKGSTTMYAHFDHIAYSVSYVYGSVADLQSGKIKPGKKGNAEVHGVGTQADPVKHLYWNNEGAVNGVALADNPTFVYEAFADADKPEREGYTFGGFTTESENGKKVEVGNWTVEKLAEEIARADNPDLVGNQPSELANDQKTEYVFTAIWDPIDYTVKYHANGATYRGTGGAVPDKKNTHWDSQDILIDELMFDNDGFTNLEWYVDSDCTQLAGENAADPSDPTLEEIAANWHKWYKGQHDGVDSELPKDIHLYAKWRESTVPITFTVSSTTRGWISKDGTNEYEPFEETYRTYDVGVKTGYINGDADAKQTLQEVTAAAADGYSIKGWYLNNDFTKQIKAGDSFKLTEKNGSNDKYTEARYVALVEGSGDVGMTVYDFFQNADGTWPKEGQARPISSDEYGKKNGETIPAADLAADEVGFEFDSNRTADLVVGPGATTELYYNRALYTLSFDVAIEGNPTTRPAAAPSRGNQLFGSEQKMPTAAAAPPGYTFVGFYTGFNSFADMGSEVTGGKLAAGMPAYDLTVTAVYLKNKRTVTITGVQYDNGDPAVADDAFISPESVTVGVSEGFEAPITIGTTLADANYYITLTCAGEGGSSMNIGSTADGATKLSEVTYGSSQCISWKCSVNGGASRYVSDPTKVPITGDTVFTAVTSIDRVITYLPGEHGTFGTSQDLGTRIVVPTEKFNMGDYLYGSVRMPEKQAAGPVTAYDENNDNSGLPAGEDGWVFDGWYYQYVTPGRQIVDSSSSSGVGAVDDQYLAANLKNMQSSITLTAAWKPASSMLTFDLNKPAAGGVTGWVDGNDPSGMKPTYDGKENSRIMLPKQEAIDVEGWTLSKWIWETKVDDGSGKLVDATFEYQPGTKTFEMPARLKNEETVLKAVWVEDPATFTYATNDINKGSVTTGYEQVGVWTGKPIGQQTDSPIGPKGSEVGPKDGYNFTGWTAGGNPVTAGVDENGKLVPERVDGKYVSTDYVAVFSGDDYAVTLTVDEDDFANGLGNITDAAGNPISGGKTAVQTVAHGGKVDLKKVMATPTDGNEYANGNYWDYVMYEGTTNVEREHGTLDNAGLADLKIYGNTTLTVHFKEGTGQYTVIYNTMSDDTRNYTLKRAWNEEVPLRAAKKLGYTWTGWFTDVPPASETSPSSSNYEEQPGSTKAGTAGFTTYGELAGSSFATTSPDGGTKDHITLRAGYTPKTNYTLYFNDNKDEGTKTTKKMNLAWNDEVTAAAQPEWLGHTFVGWFTQPKGGEQVFVNGKEYYRTLAGSDDSESAKVTVYAHWTDTLFTVKYKYAEVGESAQPIIRTFKLNQTGLNIGDPDNSDDTRRFREWTYGNGYKVGPTTTVADLIQYNAVIEDGAYVIYGSWEHKIPWTTRYALFDDDSRTGWFEHMLGYDRESTEAYDGYLQTTSYDWADATVTPDWQYANKIPGFQFNDTARDLTVQKLNLNGTTPRYNSTDEMTVEHLSTANAPEFEVAVVYKTGYSLVFNYNDATTYTANNYTHAATIAGVNSATDLTQPNKTFFSSGNTPRNGSNVQYPNPTRPGFDFGGWFTVPIEDIDNVGANDFKVEAIATANGKNDTMYGDLAHDASGHWYDPFYDPQGGVNKGELPLYAKWTEQHHQVKYAVASDMTDRVEIRLQSEPANAFSTADRTQVIGAVTGEVFTKSGDTWQRSADTAQGAVAQVKRGWQFTGWRVLDNSGARYDQTPLSAAALAAYSADANVDGTVAQRASAFIGTELAAQATGDQGVAYSLATAITAGTRTDNNLFGGAAMEAGDVTGSDVTYIATAEERENVTVDVDVNGGTYTGPTYTQPRGTYIGEAQPWGSADAGSLPDASTVTRRGCVFKGWSTDGGNTVVADAGHVAIPETGGLTLTAVWEQNSDAAITVDPNGGTISGSTPAQPWGTYVGEKAPWGSGLGALPAANTVTRPGYSFIGWQVPAGTQYVDASGAVQTMAQATTVKTTDDIAQRIILPQTGITLTAVWESNPASIRFVANDGSGTMADIISRVDKTETIPDSSFTRADYVFVNWNTAADGTGTTYKPGDQYKMTEAGLTLYAQWVQSVKDITKATIATLPDRDYTSYAITPSLTVTLDGRTLMPGTDYTVLFTNNVEVGTATATITGKGMYKGTKSATFKINHIAYKQGFTDLSMNDWYWKVNLDTSSNEGNFKGIETLYLDLIFARQIMVGYKDAAGNLTGKFGPHDNVTRAQAATILYRIANQGTTDTYNPSDYARRNTTGLPDVATGEYYTAAVNWAQANGVITGYGTPGHYTHYGPNDFVTREQMATMIYRFCVLYYGGQNRSQALTFKDSGSVSDWARAGVQYCSAMGIMAGYGTSGVFGPQDTATRCQVSKIVGVAVHDVIDKM